MQYAMAVTLFQLLLQHDELEALLLRLAETLVLVRKGLGLAGAVVAAPLVPGDEGGTHRHDGHARQTRTTLSPLSFGEFEHLPTKPTALHTRPHREHADVAGRLASLPATVFDANAGEQFRRRSQQEDAQPRSRPHLI